jgi:hypothetical protein
VLQTLPLILSYVTLSFIALYSNYVRLHVLSQACRIVSLLKQAQETLVNMMEDEGNYGIFSSFIGFRDELIQ